MLPAAFALVLLSASPLPDGFQDLEWKMSRDQVEQLHQLTSLDAVRETMSVEMPGGGDVAVLTFVENHLTRVRISFFRDFERVRTLLTEKYGPAEVLPVPPKTDVKGRKRKTDAFRFRWTNDTTSIEFRMDDHAGFADLIYESKALAADATAAELKVAADVAAAAKKKELEGF